MGYRKDTIALIGALIAITGIAIVGALGVFNSPPTPPGRSGVLMTVAHSCSDERHERVLAPGIVLCVCPTERSQ